jgi:hypothetical protein
MMRYFLFLLAIAIGVGGGLAYGWVINPVEFVETTPDTLRIDYKADYVLMVAEAFSYEKDPSLAVERLGLLGDKLPADIVEEAAVFALQEGYSDQDLMLIQGLFQVLLAWNPALEPVNP